MRHTLLYLTLFSLPQPHANATHSVTLHWYSYLPLLRLNNFCLLESVGSGPVMAQCWYSSRIAAAKQLAYLVVAGERRGWIFYSGEGGAGWLCRPQKGLRWQNLEWQGQRLAPAAPATQLLTESP